MHGVDLRHEYWTEPHKPEDLALALSGIVTSQTTFGDTCRALADHVADSIEVTGLKRIPANGPLIVIKNHPCHFDFISLAPIFDQRPDMRQLVKSSLLTSLFPSEYTLLLRKHGARANYEDIATLKELLIEGGSLVATPWGSMDHQAKTYATKERAIQNVQRFAAFAGANVLPVHIEADWATTGIPVSHLAVTINEPIVNDNPLSATMIAHAVGDLYDRYAR